MESKLGLKITQNKLRQIREQAYSVLVNNRITSKEYVFSVASKGHPHYIKMQAFWDSCFHAYILADREPNIAKNEILSILTHMNEEGFIPHMIYFTGEGQRVPEKYQNILSEFWSSPYHSNLIQPPIIAMAVHHIFETTKDIEFIQNVVPKLELYYKFLTKRDHDNDSLLAILHSWESGWDDSQRWDKLYRIKKGKQSEIDIAKAKLIGEYQRVHWKTSEMFNLNKFVVKPIDFNVIYAWNLKLMSKLCAIIGRDDSWYSTTYQHIIKRIFSKMYNGITFCDLFQDGTLSEVESAAMFFPMLLDYPFDYEEIIQKYLLNRHKFASQYGIPTTSLDHPFFNPKEYWRGNIWIQVNWLIIKGLINQHKAKLAKEIAQKSINLVGKNGFWEYFCPHTGHGFGAPNYGWDSLVYDMISYFMIQR
ncbi:MAG: amylo-alpha-1,6-glucosidase [Promethearchaeota archaeon]